MRTILLGLGLLCLSVSVSAQQVAKGLTASNGTFIGFYEYKPTNYNPAIKYPLIIFLHGIGERGNGTTELPWVLNNAIPRYISQGNTMTFTNNGKTETFLVLSPQLSKSYGYWDPFYVDEMLKYAYANLSVDPNRVYLTGLSLGGGGVWRYSTFSSDNAAKFAAVVPVCGTQETIDVCNLTKNNVAVWAFHAMDDGTVGVGATQNAEMKIGWCQPGYPAKFTYYPTGGHAIWDRAFSYDHSIQNPNVYEWMLSQSRSGTQLGNQSPISNAGTDQSITMPASTATLNGSASKDNDGTIASYLWSMASGPSNATISTSNAVTTNVSGLVEGIYVFKLQVTDNNGASSTSTVQVTVINPNTRHEGYIGTLTPGWAACGDVMPTTIHVYWNGTLGKGTTLYTDANKTIFLGHKWENFGFSPVSGTSQITTAKFFTDVTGSIVDGFSSCGVNGGLENVGTNPINQAPIANAGIDQTIILPANSATLNGSASKDNDGTITNYSWSVVSGPSSPVITNANAVTATVSGLVQGIYAFKLLVTDNNGATSTATVQVTVTATSVNIRTDGYIGTLTPGWAACGDVMTTTIHVYWNGTLGNGTILYTDAGRTVLLGHQWENFGFSPTSGSSQAITAKFYTGVKSDVGGFSSCGASGGLDYPVSSAPIIQAPVISEGYIGTLTPGWAACGDVMATNIHVYWNGTLVNGTILYTDPSRTVLLGRKWENFGFSPISGSAQPITAKFYTDITGSIVGGFGSCGASGGLAYTSRVNSSGSAIEVNAENNLQSKLFPNPAHNFVTLEYTDNEIGVVKINIFNQIGKLVKVLNHSKSSKVLQLQIDINDLSRGFYFMEVVTSAKNNKPAVFKFEKL